jgi:serine phosphatase RsbU (regulator of sigma subunit)
MRKKILFQIAGIIAAFMIALLLVIQVAISHSSTRLFIEAKEELLSLDLQAMSEDACLRGHGVPALMNYCLEHMDEVSTDVVLDEDFREAYKRIMPGLLERCGAKNYNYLNPSNFPDFSLEEQAVYAHFWYFSLTDEISSLQEYYGFSGIAILDVSEGNFGKIFSLGTTENGLDRQTLESVIADENKRNGTLDRIAKGEQAEAAFGMAYCGKKGDWFVGYYPLLPMTETSRYAVCIVSDLNEFKRSLSDQLLRILLFVFAVIAVFAWLLIWFLNRKTVRPVTQIQQSVRRYTDDKDTGQIVADMKKVRPENEIGILAGDISHLAEEMERYTRENMGLVAEREHISTEMNLARNIQAAALPSRFPAFPERNEFDLYASMTPAKEVGGDFYDFFLIDDDHLAMVIADVSGKGVSAALFMMVSKALIRNQLMSGCDPAQALQRANAQLCENNEMQMFVTVWAAVLEISTGKGLACNAGHENPGIRHSDGPFELLTYMHSIFLGATKKAKYVNREFEMKPGSSLFVYTDGVPEANDENEEMFGEERLKAALNLDCDAAPEDLIGHVRSAINSFVGAAPQFDDITMLAFKFFGAAAQKPETAAEE